MMHLQTCCAHDECRKNVLIAASSLFLYIGNFSDAFLGALAAQFGANVL